MNSKDSIVHPLIESLEQFSKTTMELIKLKAIEKAADTSSTITSRILLLAVAVFFTLMVTVGVALWLGDLLGKSYYGFFIMGLFYAIAGIVLIILHPKIKSRVADSIVKHTLN